MKPLFLALFIAGFLISCNNAGTDKQADGADSTQNEEAPSPRRALVDAVNELKATLQSNDKNRVAELFEFPIADTIMGVYLDDSVFMKIYRSSGDRLTKPVFLKYYDTISRVTNLADIIELFEHIPVDSLLYKDEFEKVIVNKKEPCALVYGIMVEGESVTFRFGTIRNINYDSPNEDETDGCEYSSMWMFRFDGKKLRYERTAVAG